MVLLSTEKSTTWILSPLEALRIIDAVILAASLFILFAMNKKTFIKKERDKGTSAKKAEGKWKAKQTRAANKASNSPSSSTSSTEEFDDGDFTLTLPGMVGWIDNLAINEPVRAEKERLKYLKNRRNEKL